MAEQDGVGSLNKDLLQSLADFIVRPPRMEYSERDLGMPDFRLRGRPIRRRDITVKNASGESLVASIFEPRSAPQWDNDHDDTGPLPCVIFCHGNSGSRLDADRLGPSILPYGMKMLAFDFSGSGLSDGDYISLGIKEKEDIEAVVSYLKSDESVSQIAIHGQSMGAASTIMYVGSRRDPGVSCVALDSAYASFTDISKSMVDTFEFPVPVPKNVLLSVGVRFLKKAVKEKAGFNLDDIKPIHYAKSCEIPALFIHGTEDQVVTYSQGVHLHKTYACNEKELLTHQGGSHHEIRPREIRAREFCFLIEHLFPIDDELTYFKVLKTRANDLLTGSRFDESIYFYTAGIQRAEAFVREPTRRVVSTPTPPRRPLSFKRDLATPPSSPRKTESVMRKLTKRKSLRDAYSQPNPLSSALSATHPRNTEGVKRFLLAFYGNRSNAFRYLKKFDEALGDAESAISLDSSWARGYQRKASACLGLDRMADAAAAVDEGLQVDPNNSPLQDLLREMARAAEAPERAAAH